MRKTDDLNNMPELLYKYCAWNKYTEQILINHQLYFANPDDVNDPYECKPFVEETAFRILPGTQLNLPRKDGLGVSSTSVISGKFSMSYNLQKNIVTQQWSSYRICSFSKRNDIILLWSHYANYHNGICLVFSTKMDDGCFNFGSNIYYSSKRPVSAVCQSMEKVNPLNTKFKAWQYEDEFRLIKTPTDMRENKDSQLFSFNPEALTEIILGAKTSKELYHNIKKLCMENQLSHVKFYKMQISDTKQFKLKKEPIFD